LFEGVGTGCEVSQEGGETETYDIKVNKNDNMEENNNKNNNKIENNEQSMK
jgi:hypothetical protein